jgi:hypothetical protein
MWWGNWEAAKKDNSLTNYELCDGAKVDTDGPLKDKAKPNFMKAFPRGLGPGLTNGQEQGSLCPWQGNDFTAPSPHDCRAAFSI